MLCPPTSPLDPTSASSCDWNRPRWESSDNHESSSLSLSLSLSLSFLIMWNSVQAEVAYLSEVRSGVLRVLGFRVEGFLRLN